MEKTFVKTKYYLVKLYKKQRRLFDLHILIRGKERHRLIIKSVNIIDDSCHANIRRSKLFKKDDGDIDIIPL